MRVPVRAGVRGRVRVRVRVGVRFRVGVRGRGKVREPEQRHPFSEGEGQARRGVSC